MATSGIWTTMLVVFEPPTVDTMKRGNYRLQLNILMVVYTNPLVHSAWMAAHTWRLIGLRNYLEKDLEPGL